VAFRFYVVPDVLDLAIGADQKRAAHNSQERLAEEVFHAPRAVGFDHFKLGIAQQRKIQLLLFLEAGLRFYGIPAGSQDDHIQLVELLLCVTKLGRFGRSTRGVGLRKEKQEHALAAKIGERHVFAVVSFYLEFRSLIASFQHAQSPQSSWSAAVWPPLLPSGQHYKSSTKATGAKYHSPPADSPAPA